jgi:hypothetical protein
MSFASGFLVGQEQAASGLLKAACHELQRLRPLTA